MGLLHLRFGEGAAGVAVAQAEGLAGVASLHLAALVAIDQLRCFQQGFACLADRTQQLGGGDGIGHHQGQVALGGRHGGEGCESRLPAVAPGGGAEQRCQGELEQVGGLRQIEGFRLLRMQLAEPAGQPSLHQQLGGPARVEQGMITAGPVFAGNLQGGQGLLQDTAGFEVVEAARFAGAAPEFRAALAADHSGQLACARSGSLPRSGRRGRSRRPRSPASRPAGCAGPPAAIHRAGCRAGGRSR